jgi:hypothetical protein
MKAEKKARIVPLARWKLRGRLGLRLKRTNGEQVFQKGVVLFGAQLGPVRHYPDNGGQSRRVESGYVRERVASNAAVQKQRTARREGRGIGLLGHARLDEG